MRNRKWITGITEGNTFNHYALRPRKMYGTISDEAAFHFSIEGVSKVEQKTKI